jgi:hypothetical protein
MMSTHFCRKIGRGAAMRRGDAAAGAGVAPSAAPSLLISSGS